VKESTFSNAASPQTEGSAKAESELTFTIDSEKVTTVAHWVPATAQVLDDWGQLGRIIDQKLRYGLKLKEEMELLMGDGLGDHLTGLISAATAYASSYDQTNDNLADTLRWAILEAEDDDEEVDFIVLNPIQWYTILGLKGEQSGTANTGTYIVQSPVGAIRVPTLWGKKVVVTNTMTAGKFLVGSSSQCEIFDRMQAAVLISTEHDDYFTRNMVAIRCEERLAFCVYRSAAFIYGTFS
jgi:HK97 family phage major capsid protein